MNIIYTIGYSGFNIDNFIKTLQLYRISCLIDVRSTAKSAYFVDFNKTNLSNTLNMHKILYRHYDKEFGARQLDEQYYTEGVLDFVKFAKSPQFLDGIRKIETGMQLGYTFVLMCAEKRPEDCHRNIMIARQFHLRGYEIRNILDDGNYIRQDVVENILLNKYFPDRNQMSLFEQLDPQEMIEQSYWKRNLEIGHHLQDDGEKYE